VWAALPIKGQGEPMTIPELQVSRIDQRIVKAAPDHEFIHRKPLDPRLPRSVREKHSRTNGSTRREPVSLKL
jgi:hypothetical protein